jgi:hypothetical protein
MGGVSLFTFTSKMSCASFSIAAGPLGESKGTCRAANLTKDAMVKFSTDVEREGGFANSQFVAEVGHRNKSGVGEAPKKSIDADKVTGMYICDACYAGKGNYGRLDSVQIYQIARKAWVDITMREGTFVPQMVGAMRDLLGNESLMGSNLASSGHFRIHDSGDWFSIEYMNAWFQICAAMHDVKFWAPSRMWVFPEFRQAMIAGKPANLTLRPSALVYGSLAPMVRGLSAGSTSSRESLMNNVACHWDCPAYLTREGSCASARCRTCWDRPEVPVNYKVH